MPRIEKQVTILNKHGLNSRASAAFVDVVKKFNSEVTVVDGKERVNGKSILALLMLGAKHQASLLLIVDGHDAEAATAEFEKFFINEADKDYSSSISPKILIYVTLLVFAVLLFKIIFTHNL